ncbi:hypothetical protein WDW37_18135 [Bdellovibrionota bacterium FG-1]
MNEIGRRIGIGSIVALVIGAGCVSVNLPWNEAEAIDWDTHQPCCIDTISPDCALFGQSDPSWTLLTDQKSFIRPDCPKASEVEKSCKCCGRSKPLAKFDRNRTKPDGRDANCKACVSNRKAKRYAKAIRLRKRCIAFNVRLEGSIHGMDVDEVAGYLAPILEDLFYGEESSGPESS